MQNAMIEMSFHLLWSLPPVAALGAPRSQIISEAPQEDLRSLVQVQDALDRIEQGGFAEGVIRMLILMAHSRREVRRSRLERSNLMLVTTEPFASMRPKTRTRLIHRESLIVGFEPEAAITALPKLIQGEEDRRRALALCWEIAGPREEMSPETLVLMGRLAVVLGQEATPTPPEEHAQAANSEPLHPLELLDQPEPAKPLAQTAQPGKVRKIA